MHVLLAETGSREFVQKIRELGWGRMYVTKKPNPFSGERWGFDNGAFACWRNGVEFDEKAYLKRLDRASPFAPPYLAVVPDVVGGGMESLAFSTRWVERLPEHWGCWYLAVQDGMKPDEVATCMHLFDGVFLGGTDKFKASASLWRGIAQEAGVPFHYARCGTVRKLQHAIDVGADSIDSSFPLWSRERFSWFIECATNGHPQKRFGFHAETGRN